MWKCPSLAAVDPIVCVLAAVESVTSDHGPTVCDVGPLLGPLLGPLATAPSIAPGVDSIVGCVAVASPGRRHSGCVRY